MGECDRKSLIEVKAHLRVCLFLCMASYPPRVPGEQGSRRGKSDATYGAHTSPSTKSYNKHCTLKDCLNTVLGECDRKLLID